MAVYNDTRVRLSGPVRAALVLVGRGGHRRGRGRAARV